MSDDDAKKLILSRRARFVAAALAASGLASCSPTPCLDIATPPSDASNDGTTDAPTDGPQVCLGVAQDASAPDAPVDANDGSVGDAGTG